MKKGKNLEASSSGSWDNLDFGFMYKKIHMPELYHWELRKMTIKRDIMNFLTSQLIDVLSAVFKLETNRSIWPLIRIYRGGFLLIEFLFLLGINTYGWRQAGVNHVLIFELNPRSNLSHQHLFEVIKARRKVSQL